MGIQFQGRIYGDKKHIAFIPVDLLFDTGSLQCLIREDIALKIGEIHYYRGKPHLSRDAIDKPVIYIGMCTLWFGFFLKNPQNNQEQFLEISAKVVRNFPDNMIIGADFLQKNNFSIQFNPDGENIILYQNEPITDRVDVTVHATETSPPKSYKVNQLPTFPIFTLPVIGDETPVTLRCIITTEAFDTAISINAAQQITTDFEDWSDDPQSIRIATDIMIKCTQTVGFKIAVDNDHNILVTDGFVGNFDTTDFDIIIGKDIIDLYGIKIQDGKISFQNYKDAFRV